MGNNIEPRTLAGLHIAQIEKDVEERKARNAKRKENPEGKSLVINTAERIISEKEALVAYLRKLMALDTEGVDLIPDCEEYAAFYEKDSDGIVEIYAKNDDYEKTIPLAYFRYDPNLPGFECIDGDITDSDVFRLTDLLDATM